MNQFCTKCGEEISDNLYCEKCGEETSNLPTSFSKEESLAGLIVSTLSKAKSISFSEVEKIETNKEKIFRIFAQLERTKNYSIEKLGADYFLKVVDSTAQSETSKKALIAISKNKNLVKSLISSTPLEMNDFK